MLEMLTSIITKTFEALKSSLTTTLDQKMGQNKVVILNGLWETVSDEVENQMEPGRMEMDVLKQQMADLDRWFQECEAGRPVTLALSSDAGSRYSHTIH